MTWKRLQPILMIFLIIIIFILFAWNSIEHFAEEKETCAWCFNIIWGEGTQRQEYWLCQKCWSELRLQSGRIKWGNLEDKDDYEVWEWERMQWIYTMIEERKTIDKTPNK